MTFTEHEVEWIVVEVIRRLGLLDTNPKRERGVSAFERSSTTADLMLTEKVITIRTIEGRLTGITRLIALPRAIVTPAVRDELKARNVELVRQTP